MNIAYAYVINKQLHDTIIGKTLKNVIANQNPHTFVWFAMEPSQASQYNQIAAPEIAKYMINNVIEKCAVFNGAQNCLYIGDRVLMSDITPRFYNALERPPKKHQLLLEFEDGSILAYSASLGGVINLFQIDQNGLPMRANVNFPMILSNEFTYKFFHDIILKTDLKSLSVKQFLATKNRIPGIDNNLLQDILWDAQVNPKSKMKVLNEEEYHRIYNSIKTVTREIISVGGKDTDKDLFGNYGGFKSKVSKNTYEKPCARCATNIMKEAYLGGAIYYCPQCQKVKA